MNGNDIAKRATNLSGVAIDDQRRGNDGRNLDNTIDGVRKTEYRLLAMYALHVREKSIARFASNDETLATDFYRTITDEEWRSSGSPYAVSRRCTKVSATYARAREDDNKQVCKQTASKQQDERSLSITSSLKLHDFPFRLATRCRAFSSPNFLPFNAFVRQSQYDRRTSLLHAALKTGTI